MADERRAIRWCEALLSSAVEGMESAGYTVPDLVFVSPGEPAWDNPLLAVSLEAWQPTEGNLTASVVAPVRKMFEQSATLQVWLVIPVPTIDVGFDGPALPLAREQSAAAEELYASIFSIRNGILADIRGGRLGDLSVAFLDGRIISPAGGLAGAVQRWQVDLTVSPETP